MKVQYGALAALCLTGLAGCNKGKGEEAFLPIQQLCPTRAHDICAARELHCDPKPPATCEARENELCEQEHALFAADESLTYDSAFAQEQRNTQAGALQEGEPPFPLGAFFEGTVETGESCERDTQCQSGQCDLPEDAESGTCADVPLELCPAAE